MCIAPFRGFSALVSFLKRNNLGRQRTGRWRSDRSGTERGMAFLMTRFMGNIQVYVLFFLKKGAQCLELSLKMVCFN